MLIGLLAVSLPIIVIGATSMSLSMGSITQLAKNKMGETASSLAGGLDLILHEQILFASSIARFDCVRQVMEGRNTGDDSDYRELFLRLQKTLTDIKNSEEDHFSSLVLVGEDQKIFLSSDNGKFIGLDLTGRAYLKEVFQGKSSIGSVVFSRATGKVIATAASPVFSKSGNKVLGGVTVTLLLDFLFKTVKQINSGQLGYTYLVDASGRYIVYPEKDKILTFNISQINGMDEVLLQSKIGRSGFAEYEIDGIKKFAAYAPIPTTGWTVVNTMAKEQLYASARKIRNVIIISSLFFLVLALGGFFRLAKSIASPMEGLALASNTIAGGDLDIRVVGESRQDEIGALARAFNNMAGNLRQARRKEEKNSWLKTGIARLSESLSGDPDITTLSSSIINEVANNLNAQIGALYIMEGGEDPVLELKGSYAFSDPDGSRGFFKPGEGLIGQSVLEKRRIIVNNVPDDYFRITSGLGERIPKVICVMPFLYEEQVKGVLELGMLGEINELVLEYLDRIELILAVAVESAHNRAKLADALEQSQRYGEKLQVQQEELRVTNEELEEQTQLLQDSQGKLKSQHEEVQAINAALEEKNDLLNQQKQEVEKAQEEINRKAEEAKLANKYKSEFLANMSHELRTPLNSLLLLAQGLARNKEGTLTPDQMESARIIYGSGSDLLNLINEILDLSKIEAGRMEIETRERSISDFVESIRASFAHMAKDKGIVFEVNVSPEVPEYFFTDPKRTDQIIRNFISNAIKFTESGSVTVAFSKPAQGIRMRRSDLDPTKAIAISVTDTGIGISTEDQRTVFEAFTQADGGISRKYGGTGLGLSISRELAQLLGGEIQLESKPGVGSTFTLYLPIRLEKHKGATGKPPKQISDAPKMPAAPAARADAGQPDPVREQPVADDRDRIAKNDKVILIIEDDTTFAGLIAKTCRELGFKCLTASNGRQGVELALQHIPDGVVLDIRMPGMDGWTVLDMLKKDVRTRHIPVHIISVEESANKSLQKGAIGHATKPIRHEELVEILGKLKRISEERKKQVLVVEDNENMRRNVKDLIADQDVEVIEAASGAEAIELMKSGSYGCLILDLGLPDMNGFQLLELLGKEGVSLPPVIVHTSKDLTEQEELNLREHADSIVIKDVRSQERLLDEVSLFLHRMVVKMPETKKQMIIDLHENNSLLKGKKVLIVDDDMRTAFALSRLMADRGLTSLKAPNGEKALEILDSESDIDLVLMDIMMPVMNGYETMKKIREQEKFRKLPIIALTAKAMPEDRTMCLEAGASDYLPKPVDQERLLSMMRIWLYQ